MGMTLKELLTKGRRHPLCTEVKALAARHRMDGDTSPHCWRSAASRSWRRRASESDVDSIIAEVENAENNNDDMGLADENEEDAEENPADLKAAMDELLDDLVKNYSSRSVRSRC